MDTSAGVPRSVWTRLYFGDAALGVEEVQGHFCNVSQFKKAVQQTWPRSLKDAEASDLVVYASEDKKAANAALAVDEPLAGYKTSAANPLVVVATVFGAGASVSTGCEYVVHRPSVSLVWQTGIAGVFRRCLSLWKTGRQFVLPLAFFFSIWYDALILVL